MGKSHSLNYNYISKASPEKLETMFWIILIFIIAVLIIAPIIGNNILLQRFDKEVAELFSNDKPKTDKIFNSGQLSNLPKPVQGYFRHTLKEGQTYINSVRLLHSGKFKTDIKKDWVNIKGEQYFTAATPGFIWKGKTKMFTARDMYIADTGRLIVSLFSLFKVVDGKGENFNQGELLRWLGESVWFPTNLLPSENLNWFPINDSSAKLTFNYKGLSVFYIVTFNNKNEIVQMETERYMGDANLEKWVGKLADYKEINGVIIPTKIEALWRLKEGDFSYVNFNLDKIEYDKPNRF